MGIDLTIAGLDEATIARLRLRAEVHGRSLTDEAAEVLRDAVARDVETFMEAARKCRQATSGKVTTSTTDILREIREGR
ncbi:FitA-like ribbon-helix-helix domain-containing protein [Caenispirillum bisanense]|uniref:Antitoxin FitA-like ribbon-helix-helix domain-containing protein n=1 Tax=Caenispirillum bisanense TaxID=414052 RepID=A0A286G1F6_9PROT|nr:hypothetical protein [Caenispirillum bisanense]SOD89282.1 hypothetical protein SAMN05421508_101172 [Caenispirillum bisanense]